MDLKLPAIGKTLVLEALSLNEDAAVLVESQAAAENVRPLSRNAFNASIARHIVDGSRVSVVSMNEYAHLDSADSCGAHRFMTFR